MGCYKEAQAWRDNDQARALRFLELEKSFINEHLKNWVPEFCNIMEEEARTSFYKAVAVLTKGFLEIEGNQIKDLPMGIQTEGVT
jgi:anaerobic sulfite reductase subunit A